MLQFDRVWSRPRLLSDLKLSKGKITNENFYISRMT